MAAAALDVVARGVSPAEGARTVGQKRPAVEGNAQARAAEQKPAKKKNRQRAMEAFEADPHAVPTDYCEAARAALASPGMARLRASDTLRYDTKTFDFRAALRDAFSSVEPEVAKQPLEKLHVAACGADFQADNSFKAAKRKLVDTNDIARWLQPLYQQFLEEFVCQHIRDLMAPEVNVERVVVQAAPSLRLQPPSEHPIGHAHRDCQYRHQCGQVNFWLPVTKVLGNNSLWVEQHVGQNDFLPLELDFGQVHRFWGHRLMHKTMANDTDITRVSLDFRVVPGPCFDADPPEARQSNGRTMFGIGGYYFECLRDSGTGTWKLQTKATAIAASDKT
eukprot:TRINITY_DN36305_c0_g1_i1.p1 TRINITY_DN36305_c0_g1~~TRINITY_DN36305_c0_g1_i1.p1  ORF type:complete len:368 (+),score=87.69 TRINITY_DN36305_c0_g1_i1:100-1104(+)